MKDYIFYYENEGINGLNSFKLKAKSYLDAYNKGRKTLGHEVNRMNLELAPKEQSNSSNNPE
jgi:hypothetical protein